MLNELLKRLQMVSRRKWAVAAALLVLAGAAVYGFVVLRGRQARAFGSLQSVAQGTEPLHAEPGGMGEPDNSAGH